MDSSFMSFNYEIGQAFELDLANIIKGIAFQEISIENEKIQASENPSFDVFAAWESLDYSKKGTVDVDQMENLLGKNSVACSQRAVGWLINIISRGNKEIKQAQFVQWLLPYANVQLKLAALKRRDQNIVLRRIHNFDEISVRQTSETLTVRVLSKELQFFTELENLKQQFSQFHAQNIRNVWKCLEFSRQGTLNYKAIKDFMQKLHIQFNDEECYGFFQRTSSLDPYKKEISYEELVRAILPSEDENSRSFQEQFNRDDLHQYVLKKAQDFQFNITKPSFGCKPPIEKKQMMQHLYPFRKVFDPCEKGKMTFKKEVGYLKELESFNRLYFDPCRDNSEKIGNSRKDGGIRNHDNFYDNYYALLYEREQQEILYNKLGKRYAHEGKIGQKVNCNFPRARATSAYTSQSHNNSLNQTQINGPYFKPAGDSPEAKRTNYGNSFLAQESSYQKRDNTLTLRLNKHF